MNQNHNSRQQFEYLPFQSLIVANQIGKEECLVCAEHFDPDDLILFGDCGHSFCYQCLSQHITYALKRYNIPKCPYDLCSAQLSQNSKAYSLLGEEQRQRYKKIISYLIIIKSPNFLPCQKENCTGLIDKSESQQYCNLCGEKHCSMCYQLAHTGECRARVAMELQTREKFRQCSKCSQIIEKSEGCTHMQCTCGHYFCYSCGQTLGSSEHECVPPSELNFLESIRWSIEHEQLWYQSNSLNFLKYLLLVSPSRQANTAVKVVWALTYFLILFPLSMALTIGIALVVLIGICSLFLLFTFFIPFLGLFSDGISLWPTTLISEECGIAVAGILVLLFYPILYFINLVEFFMSIAQEEDFTLDHICFLHIHLWKGIRNMFLMSCLMLIDNENYYLGLGQLRHESLIKQQYLQEIYL